MTVQVMKYEITWVCPEPWVCWRGAGPLCVVGPWSGTSSRHRWLPGFLTGTSALEHSRLCGEDLAVCWVLSLGFLHVKDRLLSWKGVTGV